MLGVGIVFRGYVGKFGINGLKGSIGKIDCIKRLNAIRKHIVD